MLDVLEDYLRLAGHATERIDGSTAARDRQAAIDRFSKGGAWDIAVCGGVCVRVVWWGRGLPSC